MKAFTLAAAINADGYLWLDVPTQLAPGQVELVLVIQSSGQDASQSRCYDFSDLVGN